jgi:phage shock protein C
MPQVWLSLPTDAQAFRNVSADHGTGSGIGLREGPGSFPDVSGVPLAQTRHMTGYQSYEPSSTHPRKRLVRRTDDKMIAGVCSGVAAYTGLDTTLVRVLLVAAVVFGFGTGIVLYILGWLLMPQA